MAGGGYLSTPIYDRYAPKLYLFSFIFISLSAIGYLRKFLSSLCYMRGGIKLKQKWESEDSTVTFPLRKAGGGSEHRRRYNATHRSSIGKSL